MKRWYVLGFVAAGFLGILIHQYFWVNSTNKVGQFGITWAQPYAESLGLNSQEGLIATLDDLGVRHFRIPAYWTTIEAERGRYQFKLIEEQLDEIAKRSGKAVLVVGARQPRWPECWVPDWAKALSQKDRADVQLAYVRATFEQFTDHPAIAGWQVENEPTLTWFMECPGLSHELVRAELNLVRRLELEDRPQNRRPIIMTYSGELSPWTTFAGASDQVGISIYRAVRNPWLGIIRYWYFPANFYNYRYQLAKHKTGEVIVTEFQMEPWTLGPLPTTPLDEQLETFDINQMKANLAFVERLDFTMVYYWGVEWWYWMKEKQGRPEFWNLAKTIPWK